MSGSLFLRHSVEVFNSHIPDVWRLTKCERIVLNCNWQQPACTALSHNNMPGASNDEIIPSLVVAMPVTVPSTPVSVSAYARINAFCWAVSLLYVTLHIITAHYRQHNTVQYVVYTHTHTHSTVYDSNIHESIQPTHNAYDYDMQTKLTAFNYRR